MSLRSTLPQLSDAACSSWWSLLNPAAWAGGCAIHDAKYITGTTDTLTPEQLAVAPVLQPPIAPQTADAMATWSPSMANEALAQKYGQYALQTTVQKQSATPTSSSISIAPNGSNWIYWALAAVAVIVALKFVR